MLKKFLFVLLVLLAPSGLSAHDASDSYIRIQTTADKTEISWDIAVRDLDFLLGLDENLDGDLTWGEIKAQETAISEVALQGMRFMRGDSACGFSPAALSLTEHDEDSYIALQFDAICASSQATVRLVYDFMFDEDPSHRAIIRYNGADGKETLLVAAPETGPIVFQDVSLVASFVSFLVSGFDHILEGYDHILFLTVLIFSVVLSGGVKSDGGWRPYIETIKLLTVFTVAHAVTITLAQTGVMSVPGKFVESVIALSIVIAATDNFYPFLGNRRWAFAFGFGLIHGLGFASALGPVALEGQGLASAIIGFNAGVELGQILVAALVVFLLTGAVRNYALRVKLILTGSAAAFLTGMIWFIDRSIGLS